MPAHSLGAYLLHRDTWLYKDHTEACLRPCHQDAKHRHRRGRRAHRAGGVRTKRIVDMDAVWIYTRGRLRLHPTLLHRLIHRQRSLQAGRTAPGHIRLLRHAAHSPGRHTQRRRVQFCRALRIAALRLLLPATQLLEELQTHQTLQRLLVFHHRRLAEHAQRRHSLRQRLL